MKEVLKFEEAMANSVESARPISLFDTSEVNRFATAGAVPLPNVIRHPENFRPRKLCTRWQHNGTCLRGSQCIFAHGTHELHTDSVTKLAYKESKLEFTGVLTPVSFTNWLWYKCVRPKLEDTKSKLPDVDTTAFGIEDAEDILGEFTPTVMKRKKRRM